MKKKPASRKNALAKQGPGDGELLGEVRELILDTRQTVARTVNAALTLLHWEIGRRIHAEVLKEQRAGYGEEIVAALRRQLTTEFGRGFDEKSLRHMIRFAEAFPEREIVSALRRELSWTHFKRLIRQELDALRQDEFRAGNTHR